MNAAAFPRSAQLEQLHQTYCRLTGQNLSLRFDRERFWFEFLRAGFTLADLVQVVRYLQKEIRHTRRNVGALKLSNLLNWTASRRTSTSVVFVSWPNRRARKHPPICPLCSPAEQERGRRHALEQLGGSLVEHSRAIR